MVSERLGITPFVVGRILNHSTETGGAAKVTLKTYALYDFTPEKRRALEAWEALLFDIVDNQDRMDTQNLSGISAPGESR